MYIHVYIYYYFNVFLLLHHFPFPSNSHNERKTQWEDPRLGISLPPSDHSNPFGLHPRPMYPGTGGDQLSHLQPHPHHMPPNHHFESPHYSMRHHANNRSVDVTALSGMGSMDVGNGGGGGMNHYHHQRPQSASHQQSHSFAGHMHGGHMSGGGYFGMGGGAHGQLHSKRSFDFTMGGMDHHRIPVTLQGDPYLSEHGRQASHDSGLGYPVTPYQGEQGMLDYEEGFDGGVHNGGGGGGPMGSSNQLNHEQNIQGVPNNHGLLDHIPPPSSGELGGDNQQQPMEFGGEMLGEFGNQPNQIFPTGEWV